MHHFFCYIMDNNIVHLIKGNNNRIYHFSSFLTFQGGSVRYANDVSCLVNVIKTEKSCILLLKNVINCQTICND